MTKLLFRDTKNVIYFIYYIIETYNIKYINIYLLGFSRETEPLEYMYIFYY